jgi:TRAP-type C4-dicarboxylate transport system substrate-binding protein
MKFALTLAAGVALSTFASAAFAETTLRYSNWLPATHPFMKQVIQPWIEDVEEVTEGRVKVEILPKVVGSVPTQFEVVRDGLADMALIVDGYSAGRFNLGSIVELPFIGNDARAITASYWRIYKKHLEKFGEYENAIPVAKTAVGGMALASGPGPIVSIDDFRGMKIRVPNATSSKIVAALGGAPVNKPITEMYELISTGVVDAMISSEETIKTFKVSGSVNHLLTVPGGLSGAGISFIVNEETLSQLSEADLEAFWSVSGEVFSTNIANIYVGLNALGRQSVVDAGGVVAEVSEELNKGLHEKLAGMDDEWIAKAQKIGLENAAEVLAEFRANIAQMEAELASQ